VQDPIRNTCLCQDASCAFTDQSKAIGPNGVGIVSPGGTGSNTSDAAKPTQFRSFNAAPATGMPRLGLVGLAGAVLAVALHA
jgi:hypothetical protein